MKKKLPMHTRVLLCVISLLTAEASAVTQTDTVTQSYGCGMVYPTEIYCPAGYVCTVQAPICIMNINTDTKQTATKAR